MYKSFGGALGVQKLNSATLLIQRHPEGSPMQSMYYIGLDVHKGTISYCVKDGSGKIRHVSILTKNIAILLRKRTGEDPPSWKQMQSLCSSFPVARTDFRLRKPIQSSNRSTA